MHFWNSSDVRDQSAIHQNISNVKINHGCGASAIACSAVQCSAVQCNQTKAKPEFFLVYAGDINRSAPATVSMQLLPTAGIKNQRLQFAGGDHIARPVRANEL
jgi:hypothetical protein